MGSMEGRSSGTGETMWIWLEVHIAGLGKRGDVVEVDEEYGLGMMLDGKAVEAGDPDG